MELLAVATARELPDGACAFVGTGLPLLSASLAKRTTAPDMMIILEAGTVDPDIEHLPVSVADPRASYRAATRYRLWLMRLVRLPVGDIVPLGF